jgi:hypothetical protein
VSFFSALIARQPIQKLKVKDSAAKYHNPEIEQRLSNKGVFPEQGK